MGTVVLTPDFDEDTHTYSVKGRVVQSVTQILKAVYPNTYAGISPEVLDRKARLGTAVHKTIELELLGRLDYASIHPRVQPYFESFMQWWVEREVGVFEPEGRFYCESGDYAGSIDFHGELDGEVWTLDWKTTLQKMKTHPIQVGGYGNAKPAPRLGAVYLDRDGKKAVVDQYKPDVVLRDWLSTLRVYQIQEQMR